MNDVLDTRQTSQPEIAPEYLLEAIKKTIAESMSNVTINAGTGGGAVDSSRPQMKHVSLADLAQDETEINISHKGGISKEIEGEESTDKLEKLKRLKGSK